MDPVFAGEVKVDDIFWSRYIELVRCAIVPYQWEVMNDRVPGVAKSHAIANFRIAAGREKGEFYGKRFQDSDVAKWLEAVAFCLATLRDPQLEAAADGLIETMGEAQWPDGYLNTYFTLAKKGERWTNERESHELYIAGHLIEAAVAYYRATGKRRFLEIMMKNADHIDSVFGPEEGKLHGYPGHQVIEMALAKLYEATGEPRYLRLAKYFLDERGKRPHFFELEAAARGEPGDLGPFGAKMFEYNQSHLPVREQRKAVGHAVRAVYMYSGMADVAALAGDASLAEACAALWDDVVRHQMAVTGGIGQLEWWEGFSRDYDLPNDTPYNETCASIGLMFWAARMSRLALRGEYYDVAEQALYNGILSGLALDGKSYFYTNLLDVVPEEVAARLDAEYSGSTRRGWFPCACCPPNLARLIASIGGYIYSISESALAVQLFIASSANVSIGGAAVRVAMRGDYLRDGRMSIAIDPERTARFALLVRIPGWCRGASARLSARGSAPAPLPGEAVDGYLRVEREWSPGDRVELDLPMPARRIKANPLVRADAGKVAIARGPLVYCLEGADNGPLLSDITLARDPKFAAEYEPGLLEGVTAIRSDATRSAGGWDGALYREADFASVPVRIKAIPYYAWANRGENEMKVWINQG
jgi:hypothetical protein